MAISLRACGSWAAVNATTQTVTLPTHVAGDMLIVRAACKPYTASITCTTSGWAAVGPGYANGSTANGNGVGSVMHRAFFKIATSDAETSPVIAWGTTAAPGGAVALSYQKGSGETWATPTGAGGGDATLRTSQTCTIGSHISVLAGDMVDFFLAWGDNYASTSPTITQAGVTYGTVSEQPATALSSGTSNDMAADGGYRLASSGTSSAAAVVTATFGNSEQGGAWQTRLRVGSYPVVASSGSGSPEANTVTYTVTFPGGAPTSGQLLIVLLGLDDAPTVNAKTGWTELIDADGDSASCHIYAAYRVADGTEGTTTDFTLSVANGGGWICYVITDFDAGEVPEVSTIATGADAAPNPGSVTPSWGSAAALWIAASAHDGNWATTYGPPGFSGLTEGRWANAEGAGIASAVRYDTATSVDPGTFTSASSDQWGAITIAVKATQAQSVLLPLLDAGAAIYSPTVEQTGGDQSVLLPLLDAGSAIYAPTVGVAQTVSLPLLDAIGTGADYWTTITDDSPIALWKLAETEGTNANDEIGTADGTHTNTPTLGVTSIIPGVADTAVTFDRASNEYVLISSNMPAGASAGCSVECTFKLSGTPANDTISTPFAWGTQAATPGFHWLFFYYLTAGEKKWYWRYADGTAYRSALSATWTPDTSAHHMVVVHDYDAETVKFWIDGSLQATADVSLFGAPLVPASGLSTKIAAYSLANHHFPGTLQGVAVYDYDLTQTQVEAHHAAWEAAGGGESIFPITVAQVAPTVSLPLLDGGAAIYAPTVNVETDVALPLLDAGAAIYSPTVEQTGGGQTVSLPLLDGGAAIYAPTINVETDVALPLLDAGAAIYAPTLLATLAVSVPLLDGQRAIYAPTVGLYLGLTVPLLDASRAIYSPTINVETDVSLPLLDASRAIYSPTVVLGPISVALPLLDGGAAIYAIGLTTTDYVLLPLLDGQRAIYAPTVSQAGGTQSVLLPLLDGGATIYAVGVIVEHVVSLPLVESTPAIYAPTILALSTVSLPLLDGSKAIYAPTLTTLEKVYLPLLDGQRAIYAVIVSGADIAGTIATAQPAQRVAAFGRVRESPHPGRMPVKVPPDSVVARSLYDDLKKRYGGARGLEVYLNMAHERKGPFGKDKKYDPDRRAE